MFQSHGKPTNKPMEYFVARTVRSGQYLGEYSRPTNGSYWYRAAVGNTAIKIVFYSISRVS